MNKCPKCGREYEGKFCPDCGTPFEREKNCPNCGAKLNGSTRFCNECGYSFYEQPAKTTSAVKSKQNNFIPWVKSHLKIVIAVALVAVLVIVLACSIPACVKAKHNGTYYKINYNGKFDKETYFILKSGKWSDEDGASGTYKTSGEKITFYMTFMGETDTTEGTIKDYVLTVNDEIYVSEKHKHEYGEWKTDYEATCTTDGRQSRSCACGVKETKILYLTGTAGLKYDLKNNEYAVQSIGTAVDSDIYIPKFYNGLPVTSIGKSAFENCSSLTSITIPDSVTSIGYSAFEGCSSLTSIYYTGDIKGWCEIKGLEYLMGLGAENCKLFIDNNEITGEIEIPNGVTSIGESAFKDCSSLTSITIPDSVTSIGNYAFYGCSSLTSITIPDSVTSISGRAFYGCSSLTSITIPDGVTSISGGAFQDCSSLKYNFYDNGLYLGNTNNPYLALITAKNQNITNCIINESTKVIAGGAFAYCTDLTGITLPDSVTSIGYNAFWGCSSLTSITIPDSVTSIGGSAFYGCSRLRSITIPDSVTSIGYSAFEGCSSLTSITFKGSKEQWKAIRKGGYWNSYTGDYTVHCTDGDIT